MPKLKYDCHEKTLMNTTKDHQDLIDIAHDAKENSYSPYYGYAVGAAVVTRTGDVYTGANIENITLDMCSHAERTALKTALADGQREFSCLAISTQSQDGMPPCLTCRQFLTEFLSDDFLILSDAGEEKYKEYTLGEIAPYSFRADGIEDETDFDG